jgi:hypothetical protein
VFLVSCDNQALRALGGRGTGVEITGYIDENYSQVLSNKTKTWRNSVMGCLSGYYLLLLNSLGNSKQKKSIFQGACQTKCKEICLETK